MIAKITRYKAAAALCLVALQCLVASVSTSSAEGIPGSDSETFATAVNTWLEGDDAKSLPQLAVLANEGNQAAQILLARINEKGLGATPWLTALSRNERREIFRRMDTKFGTSWMKVAAETSELAAAFTIYRQPESDGFHIDAALDLAAMGEARAASELLPTLVFAQQWSEVIKMAEVAKASGFEPFAWIAATYDTDAAGARDLLQAGLRAAAEGSVKGNLFLRYANLEHPNIQNQSSDEATDIRRITEGRAPIAGNPTGSPVAVEELHGWLIAAPEAAPLRGLCTEYCPEAVIPCADDLYGIIYGYMSLIPLVQSPLESVIPTDKFLQSKRGIALVDDLLKASVVRRKGLLGAKSGGQECLRQAVLEN